MPSAPGWLLGVQWHPEWAFITNPNSVAIFAAFGDACRQYRTSRR
jgi:putative glutamine amidotransferase